MEQATLSTQENGVLNVDGEITFYNAATLCSQLKTFMPQDVKQVTVELANLSHCDSASLVFLITLLRQAKKHSQAVTFLNIPQAMQALIKLYNLSRLIYEGEVQHG